MILKMTLCITVFFLFVSTGKYLLNLIQLISKWANSINNYILSEPILLLLI